MKLIWVATDGSECANRAVDWASYLAVATGAKLVILIVGGRFGGSDFEQLARAEGGIGEAHDLILGRFLQEAKHRSVDRGVTSLDTLILWGDPAEEIIAKARHEKPDAVVVGRRGRGRLAGLLLGSVSQKLVSLGSVQRYRRQLSGPLGAVEYGRARRCQFRLRLNFP